MLLSFNLLAACGAILSTAAAVPTTVSISVSIRRYKAPKAQYCDLKKYYIKPNCKALYGPAWYETFNPEVWPVTPYFTCCYIYDVPPPPGSPEPPKQPDEPKEPEKPEPEDPKEPEEPEEPEPEEPEPEEPEPEEPEKPEEPEQPENPDDPPKDPEDPEKDPITRTRMDMKVLKAHVASKPPRVLKAHHTNNHGRMAKKYARRKQTSLRTSDVIVDL